MRVRNYVAAGVLTLSIIGNVDSRGDDIQNEARVVVREPGVFRRIIYEGIAVTAVVLLAAIPRAYEMLKREESDKD